MNERKQSPIIQLEKIYLANVLLYVDNVEDIITFKLINKKCMDTSHMIKYFDQRRKSSREHRNNTIIPTKLLEIYPSLETIQLRSRQTNQEIIQLLQQNKQIRLPWIYLYGEWKEFLSTIDTSIIELKLELSSEKDIVDLTPFVSLQTLRIRLESSNPEILYQFLSDKNMRLRQLVVYCNALQAEHLLKLKEYLYIKNVTIVIHYDRQCYAYRIPMEVMKQLNIFATVHTNDYVLDNKKEITIYEGIEITDVYQKYLFTQCYCFGSLDFRECHGIKRITNLMKDKCSLQIDGLKELQRLQYINTIDTLPQSVTELTIDSSFTITNSQVKYPQIKRLFYLLNDPNDQCDMTRYTGCETITMMTIQKAYYHYQLPSSLRSLSINGFIGNEMMIEELSKLTRLTSLKISLKTPMLSKDQFQVLLNHLISLEELHVESCHIEELQLPHTVTKLNLNVDNDINISQFTQLKHLQLDSLQVNSVLDLKLFSVVVPNTLDCLKKNKSIHVVNLNEINLKLYSEH